MQILNWTLFAFSYGCFRDGAHLENATEPSEQALSLYLRRYSYSVDPRESTQSTCARSSESIFC